MPTVSDLAFWGIHVALSRTGDFEVPELPDGVRQVYLIARSDPVFAGIDGWLRTHDANYALETVDAYLEIGALETAKIYSRALAVFPKGRPPRDIEKREDLLDDLDVSESFWNDLEEEYERSTEDVHALIGEYVRKHATVFRVDEWTKDWSKSRVRKAPRENAPRAAGALSALAKLTGKRMGKKK